jgi:fibronectin type 3 domain-containing protein
MRSPRVALASAAAIVATAAALFAWRHSTGRDKHTQQQMSLLLSQHSVTLNWHPSARATSYYVYRSTVSGSGYQKIGATPTLTYKDAPVPSGAVFYYVVTAVEGSSESKPSNEVKAAIP